MNFPPARAGRIIATLLLAFTIAGCAATGQQRQAKTSSFSASANVAEQGSVQDARRQAMQNGLSQGTASADTAVYSTAVGGNGRPVYEQTRMTGTPRVQSVAVFGETLNDGRLEVQAQMQQVAPGNRCDSNYRKTVTALPFPLVDPQHLRVGEPAGYESVLPAELLRRLARTGRYLTVTEPEWQPLGADGVNSTARPEQIMRHAAQSGAQVVIAGRVRSLEVQPLSRWNLDLARRPKDRAVEIEVQAYDGASGRMIADYRFARHANGVVVPPAQYAVGSANYFATDLGRTLDGLLDDAAARVADALRCQPFVARIRAVREGRYVIDAGESSRLRAGDTLLAYAGAYKRREAREGYLSISNDPLAVLRVTDVLADYTVAVAETADNTRMLHPGDEVHAW
ncbi:MAG: flagella assembly protein FlgT middle domain-containing protein [Chromatiales bacterium]|jgi:hypothetical protein|nr:flagella assembly protein FlgT middle domain-containing protein [Chromatiales bacterium]MDX9767005.1 flagella assembly protein FlgT middle domain-containing protein [Ectothiorhodospiraceae bacterium]